MQRPTIVKQTNVGPTLVSTVVYENYGDVKGLSLYETVAFLNGANVAGLNEEEAHRTSSKDMAMEKHNFIEGLIAGVLAR